jgi:hypothetical protein
LVQGLSATHSTFGRFLFPVIYDRLLINIFLSTFQLHPTTADNFIPVAILPWKFASFCLKVHYIQLLLVEKVSMSEKNGRNGRATLEKGFPLMLNRWVAEDDSGMEFYAIGECTRYERSARILETISKHLQQYHTGEKSSNSGKGTSRTAEPVFPVSKSPKTTLSNVADTQSSDAVVRQQYSLRPGQVDGEIIRRFFSCWVWIQDAQQAARTRPSSGATADDSQRPAWNLNAPQRGGGEGQRPSDEGKGKRNAEEGPPNDDSENEGDDHSKWPQKKKKPTQPDALRRFACPFYKRTPRKYSSFRACTDPGFLNVAKVK